MSGVDIYQQLQSLGEDPEFAEKTGDLVDDWQSRGVGIESLRPIFLFMERHPNIDYGVPGALAHFMERFYRHGYEEELLKSIERRPTFHTVGLLNRVINGAKSADDRRRFVSAMAQARSGPGVDQDTLQRIDHFLSRFAADGQGGD